jgi:hypothetical protein
MFAHILKSLKEFKMATYTDYTYKGYHVRHFSHDTESIDLVWHRDRKDRDITPIGKNRLANSIRQ